MCNFVRVCVRVCFNVSSVHVSVEYGNEGIYLCTLLNYNWFTVKKKTQQTKPNTATFI